MPTEDANSSGHLVLFHFEICKCSNVETNLSWTCLVFYLLSFEHPLVLFFSFPSRQWKSEMQILGFRSRGALFCKGTLWFEEQVHWRRHHQDVRVSSWQHFRGLHGKGFPTDKRHSYGHKLCPRPSRHITVFIRSGIPYSSCSRPVGNG